MFFLHSFNSFSSFSLAVPALPFSVGWNIPKLHLAQIPFQCPPSLSHSIQSMPQNYLFVSLLAQAQKDSSKIANNLINYFILFLDCLWSNHWPISANHKIVDHQNTMSPASGIKKCVKFWPICLFFNRKLGGINWLTRWQICIIFA